MNTNLRYINEGNVKELIEDVGCSAELDIVQLILSKLILQY